MNLIINGFLVKTLSILPLFVFTLLMVLFSFNLKEQAALSFETLLNLNLYQVLHFQLVEIVCVGLANFSLDTSGSKLEGNSNVKNILILSEETFQRKTGVGIGFESLKGKLTF